MLFLKTGRRSDTQASSNATPSPGKCPVEGWPTHSQSFVSGCPMPSWFRFLSLSFSDGAGVCRPHSHQSGTGRLGLHHQVAVLPWLAWEWGSRGSWARSPVVWLVELITTVFCSVHTPSATIFKQQSKNYRFSESSSDVNILFFCVKVSFLLSNFYVT